MGMLRHTKERYKDFECQCAPGVHQRIVQLAQRHAPDAKCHIDFGAGSGALLARFHDAGYQNSYGVDLDAENFAFNEAEFITADLNKPFPSSIPTKPDLITASEIVEHLDSPRNFLSQCWQLLQDDGILVMTIPNIAFFEGRIKFLISGDLWGFGESHYRSLRHISPMTFTQARLLFQELGYEVIEQGAAGSFATPLRRILTSPFWIPMALQSGSHVMGECMYIVGRKSNPDEGLQKSTIYSPRWERAQATDVNAQG